MYITYLKHPELHTNSGFSGPGIGETPEESRANATYWANQDPWVVTVPASRAPAWAQQQAVSTRWRYLDSVATYGYTPDGRPATLTAEEHEEYLDTASLMCAG